MIRRGVFQVVAAVFCALVLTGAARAQDSSHDEQMGALIEALNIAGTIEIMRQEGTRFGEDLANDMLSDVDPQTWAATISRIYDTDKMHALITAALRQDLSDTDLAPILAYYQSAGGSEIVALEIAARRAFLDPDTEAAAAERYEDMQDQNAPIVAQIDVLMDDSDLVGRNVMGALNSDMMFYRGLVEGGAFEMTEEDILLDVWAQEEDLRLSSRDWLRSFLLMAYQPLDSDVLEDYAQFWRTKEGRDLNRAIFVAFDQMYEEISYLLGLAVSRHMLSEQL